MRAKCAPGAACHCTRPTLLSWSASEPPTYLCALFCLFVLGPGALQHFQCNHFWLFSRAAVVVDGRWQGQGKRLLPINHGRTPPALTAYLLHHTEHTCPSDWAISCTPNRRTCCADFPQFVTLAGFRPGSDQGWQGCWAKFAHSSEERNGSAREVASGVPAARAALTAALAS